MPDRILIGLLLFSDMVKRLFDLSRIVNVLFFQRIPQPMEGLPKSDVSIL